MLFGQFTGVDMNNMVRFIDCIDFQVFTLLAHGFVCSCDQKVMGHGKESSIFTGSSYLARSRVNR